MATLLSAVKSDELKGLLGNVLKHKVGYGYIVELDRVDKGEPSYFKTHQEVIDDYIKNVQPYLELVSPDVKERMEILLSKRTGYNFSNQSYQPTINYSDSLNRVAAYIEDKLKQGTSKEEIKQLIKDSQTLTPQEKMELLRRYGVE